MSDDEVSAETISVAGMIREIRNLRVEVARLRAKLDDTIGTLAGRNRKLDWTRGRLEAAEEVSTAAAMDNFFNDGETEVLTRPWSAGGER